ncbi:MAG: hypothetical protein JNM77_06955 [Pseudonocardia sp.]|nr:hypothetical protein [Pseudonocardia sp.]
MRSLFKRLAVASATIGVLTSGMVLTGTSQALAEPCGLYYTTGSVPALHLTTVFYSIRNCHNFTVKRKLDIAGTTDEPCLTLGAGQTVSRKRLIAEWAGVRGMKRC